MSLRASTNLSRSPSGIAHIPTKWGPRLPVLSSSKSHLRNTHNTLRYHFQNINGLKWVDNEGKMKNTAAFEAGKNIGASIYGLVETNTEWRHNRGAPAKATYSNLRLAHKQAVFQHSSSRTEFSSPYKPGGTMTAVTNPWHGKVVDKGSDNLYGNWSYITLAGQQSTRITFLTVYRVNDQARLEVQVNAPTGGRGTLSNFNQQLLINRELGNEYRNPRHLCFQELRKLFSEKFSEPNHEVVMGIDANETTDICATNTIAKFARDCGLHDALAYHYPSCERPPTMITSHQDNQRVIDYVFCTQRLLHHITAVAELPYELTFGSDHAALIVDFDAAGLFGADLIQESIHVSRKLNTYNRKSVKKYKEILTSLVHQNALPQRLERLKNISIEDWDESCTRALDQIDRTHVNLQNRAEHLCVKGRNHKHKWSKKLRRAGRRLAYFNLLKRARRKRSIKKSTIDWRRQRAEIPPHPTLTDAELQLEIREAKKHLKEVKRSSAEARNAHLEEIAASREEEYGINPDSTIRQLQHMEEFDRIYRTCQQHLGKLRGQSLKELLIPADGSPVASNETTDWVREATPSKVFQAILHQNKNQFTEALHTPFVTGPLADAVTCDADSPAAQAILDGNYEINSPIPELQEFIQSMKKVPEIRDIGFEFTPQMFVQAYRRAKEKKACPRSGVHVGHYKAVVDDVLLRQLHCDKITLAFKHGVSFSRWKEVTDIMLAKEEGTPRQHRCRIIQIIETDFNFALLHLFTIPIHRAMQENNLLRPEQWATQQQSCTSAVLWKQLTMEYCRYTRIPYAWMELDAKGCFDRIVPSVTLILARRLGISDNAAKALGSVWCNLNHYIKTGHGTHTVPYGPTPTEPQTGAGQGSMFGPKSNENESNNRLTITEQKPIATVVNPITKERTSRNSTVYVDDQSLMSILRKHLANPTETAVYLRELIQTLVQKIEKLLYVCGGAFQLPKCHWYACVWKWDARGRASLCEEHEAPASLYLTAGEDPTPILIQRKSPKEACRTLGCQLAPNGSHKHQEIKLRDIANELATAAKRKEPSKPIAYIKGKVFFHPKFAFPLGVYTVPHETVKKIESIYLSPIKQKLGFPSTAANSIFYTPTKFLGPGLSSAGFSKDLDRIKLFCGHMREDTDMAKIMNATIAAAQIFLGFTTSLFDLPYDWSFYLEEGWVKELWHTVARHNIKLQWSGMAKIPLLRINDASIMETLLKQGVDKSDHWRFRAINTCRLHLRAVTISDIATADGEFLNPLRTNKDQPVPLEHSPFIWPHQPSPNDQCWYQFRIGMRNLTTQTNPDRKPHGNGSPLKSRLGCWTAESRQHFQWKVTPMKNRLYYQETPNSPVLARGRMYMRHHNSTSLNTEFSKGSIRVQDIPDNCKLAEVRVLASTKVRLLTSTQPSYHTPIQASYIRTPEIIKRVESRQPSTDYLNYIISKLPPYYTHLLPTTPITTTTYQQILDLEECEFTLYSYGQPTNDRSAVLIHWEIALPNSTPIVSVITTVRTIQEESRWKQAFQLAILGGLAYLACLQQSGINIIKINSENETSKIIDWTLYHAPRQGATALSDPTSDICRELQNWLQAMFHLIKHYDHRAIYTVEQSEEEVVSKQRSLQNATPPLPSAEILHPPAAIYTLSIEGCVFNYVPENHLFDNLVLRGDQQEKGLLQLLQDRHKIDPDRFNNIDWHTAGKAAKSLSIDHRMALAKFAFNEWPTMQKMHSHWQKTDECPLCQQRGETLLHVFSCNSPSAVGARATALRKVGRTLQKQRRSAPYWQFVIFHAFQQLGATVPNIDSGVSIPDPILQLQETLISATCDSDRVHYAWFNALQGKFNLGLTAYITEHSGTSNHVNPIRAIWTLASDIWKNRNGDLHGRTATERTTLRIRALDIIITEMVEFCNTHNIPTLPVPRGSSNSIQERETWIRWEKRTIKLHREGTMLRYLRDYTTYRVQEAAVLEHANTVLNLGTSAQPPATRIPDAPATSR